MGSQKAEVERHIAVEVGGKRHSGTVVIRGTRFHEFIVHYGGRSKSDGRKWGLGAEESRNMMVMAEALLIEMVSEGQ
jgi:hypothetical protein